MAENNVEILKKLFEARNKRDWGSLAQYVSDDLVVSAHYLEKTLKGKEAFREYYAIWDRGFPDGKGTPVRMHESGNFVIAELEGEGTHKGVFTTPFGSLEPTNRHIKIKFCNIFEFKDGKLIGLGSYLDLSAVLKQLGLLTSLGQKAAA